MRICLFFCCIVGFMGLLTLPGCNPESICLSSQHAVQTGFYSSYATTDKDTLVEKLWVRGVGGPDTLINDTTSVSKLFLPLSFETDTTAFVFPFVDGKLVDTVRFVTDKELIFVSGECGYYFKFHIREVLHTKIVVDSVAILNPIVDYNENRENVKFYLR